MTTPGEALETTDGDPLDDLAEEYARRCREGERPTIDEYAARLPEHADEIRHLFPAIAFIERGKRANASTAFGTSVSGGTSAPGATLAIERLGENRVIRELGRGGMGIVFEAEQEPLGRRVAVKVLPRHAHCDPTSRERFFREARLVARLNHPHIVPIHAFGEEQGLPYYVMPLIEGTGLDRLLHKDRNAGGADPARHAEWVARLGRQAAEALAYAHGQNILHRDIKPSNLLLDASGTLWLADFGLAKLADDLSLTSTGDLPGTLRYLAPECLSAEADARSDVYSLGVTLYELLAGRPAFLELDRVRLLQQVASHHIVAPRLLVPGLPRDIETIILKATATDPSHRYATAAAFAEDLDRFLTGRPIRARRTSGFEHFVRWCRRNRVVAGLAATSIVLALVAAVFVGFFLNAPPRPPEFRGPHGERLGNPPPIYDPALDDFVPPPPPAPPDSPRRKSPPRAFPPR